MRGPFGNTFAGPHFVACAEIFEVIHQVIVIEIGDVKEGGREVWVIHSFKSEK